MNSTTLPTPETRPSNVRILPTQATMDYGNMLRESVEPGPDVERTLELVCRIIERIHDQHPAITNPLSNAWWAITHARNQLAGEPPTAPDNDRLRASVEEMDRLSHDGFSQISGLAQLALAAMNGPDSDRHQDAIAEALRAIQGKAEDIQNCVNCVAEAVGCNYIDPPTNESRLAARQAWTAIDADQGIDDEINPTRH